MAKLHPLFSNAGEREWMAGVDGPCSLSEAPLVCCYCQDPGPNWARGSKGAFPAIPRLGGVVGSRDAACGPEGRT